MQSQINCKANLTKQREANKRLEQLAPKLVKFVEKLSKLVIEDEEILGYDLKILAAASVAFLRHSHEIQPVWNEELKIISGGLEI